MKALTKTDFSFAGQTSVYHGKVRDVYTINDDLMVMVATDRISAFEFRSNSIPQSAKSVLNLWP